MKFISKLFRRHPVARELREILGLLKWIQNDIRSHEAIRLMDFTFEHHPRFGDKKRLLCYQAQICSQNGEDGIIREIFRRIGETTKVFVEVGVENGVENNTAFLLSQQWSGYWIDANKSFLKALEREDLNNGCLKYLVNFVTRENIAGLFTQLGVPSEFDLLSLDVDQNTYYLWEGLANYRPRVVVIEYNSVIPSDVEWKVRYNAQRVWDGTQNFGASLKALENLGRRLGYSLVGCEFTGSNAFFVRNDLLANLFAEPFTSENHYEPPRHSFVHRCNHPPSILDRAS